MASVVSLAAYDVVVPSVLTLTILLVSSCSVVYKARDVLESFYTQHYHKLLSCNISFLDINLL